MENKRQIKHSIRINGLFALIVALLLAGVFLLNGIALILSNRYPLYLDLTANAAYEIGGETKALLAGLDQPVEIFVLSTEDGFSGSAYLQQAKRILHQYPRYTDQVSLTFVDYAADPTFGVAYPDLSLSYGDLIVRSGERIKHLLMANLFHYVYSADGSLTIESSRAEEAVTSAIVNVTGEEAVRVAVLTGNGVADAKLFTALLADNNYQLSAQNLTTSSLEEFDMALLFAPTADLSEEVIRKLEGFLYNGGAYGKTLFYTASAAQGPLPNLDAFLSEWGIAFGQGGVFETKAERTYQYQPFFPIALYEDTPYTDMLKDDATPFLMPLARPMELLFTARDRYSVETLLSFSETAGVRPAGAGEDFTADQAEITGPLPALVLSSYRGDSPGGDSLRSHLVASASTGVFDTVALQNSSVTNAEYFLNLLGDLAGKTDQVHIQSKSLAGKTLGLNTAQMNGLGAILVGGIPLLIIAAGVVTWLMRRYR